MALGRTHDAVNLVALPVFLYFLPKEFYIPFGAGYIVGTFLLSPDLDLKNSRPSKRWGQLRCLWLPYQSFSRHRGLSHVPVVGSILRLLYITFIVLFLYFVLLGIVSILDKSLAIYVAGFDPFGVMNKLFRSEEALFFVLGIITADIIHIVIDGIWSLLKRFT